MNAKQVLISLASVILLISCRTQQALWIVAQENGQEHIIAATEGVARRLLARVTPSTGFWSRSGHETITADMLQDVLDGRQRATTVHSSGSTVTILMKPLSIPGTGRGTDQIVLDMYNDGRQSFHLALSELDVRLSDHNEALSVHAKLDWKRWLPFLSEEQGAVYMKDGNTEVWLYTD